MDEDGRPDGLQAWMELSEATAAMRAAVNRALQQGAGLSLAENLVLCQVAMASGGRLRMVEIADQLSIGKSAVTKSVDRLEERGWVTRRRDDEDRRTVHATLTPAGAEVFRRAGPVFADAVQRHLCGPLTTAEVGQLRQLLGKLLRPDAIPPVSAQAGPDVIVSAVGGVSPRLPGGAAGERLAGERKHVRAGQLPAGNGGADAGSSRGLPGRAVSSRP